VQPSGFFRRYSKFGDELPGMKLRIEQIQRLCVIEQRVKADYTDEHNAAGPTATSVGPSIRVNPRFSAPV